MGHEHTGEWFHEHVKASPTGKRFQPDGSSQRGWRRRGYSRSLARRGRWRDQEGM
jgi:hypothetical protein